MRTTFGLGRLYGIRALGDGAENLMLGTALDVLDWLASIGGPDADITVISNNSSNGASPAWQAHIKNGVAPMLTVGTPIMASDEIEARSLIAAQLLSARTGKTWFGTVGAGFLVCEGERVALRLAAAELFVPECRQDLFKAEGISMSAGEYENWIFHGTHPASRYLKALASAAARFPDVFTPEVRVQLGLQIRQCAFTARLSQTGIATTLH